MKTAEEIIEQMRQEMPFNVPQSIKPYIAEAMQIYARQVAQQALKDAAEHFDESYFEHDSTLSAVKTKILSTPIITP